MKNKWSKYALKEGKIQSSYIREYFNRKKVRKTAEASSSDINVASGQEQEEIKLIYKPPTDEQVRAAPKILNDAWVINLKEVKPRRKRTKK